VTLLIIGALFLLLFFLAAAWAAARRPGQTTGAILLLLLVHELLIRWLQNLAGLPQAEVTLVSLWKDVALAGLLVGTVFKSWQIDRDLRSRLVWRPGEPFLAAFAALGILGVVLSPDRLAGVAAYRDYFEPVVFYVVIRLTTIERKQLSRLLKAWLIVGAAMAVLAIWQSGWTTAQFAAWGFGTPSGQVGIPIGGVIGKAGLRPPSTVTGPNELAGHMILMACAAFLLIFESSGRKRTLFVVAAVLYGGALVASASRSGFLGLLLGLAVATAFAVIRKRQDVGRLGRRAWIGLGGALAVMALMAVIVAVSGMGSLIGHTIQSLAGQYHTLDTLGAVNFLVQHPQGVGMGLVGPRQGFGFPAVAAFHVEGSYFQMAMEFGVWGLAIFLVFLFLALRQTWREGMRASPPTLRVLSGVSVAGWLGVSVTFLFLPLMQAFPLMAWLWFALGIGLQARRLDLDDQAESVGHSQS